MLNSSSKPKDSLSAWWTTIKVPWPRTRLTFEPVLVSNILLTKTRVSTCHPGGNFCCRTYGWFGWFSHFHEDPFCFEQIHVLDAKLLSLHLRSESLAASRNGASEFVVFLGHGFRIILSTDWQRLEDSNDRKFLIDRQWSSSLRSFWVFLIGNHHLPRVQNERMDRRFWSAPGCRSLACLSRHFIYSIWLYALYADFSAMDAVSYTQK